MAHDEPVKKAPARLLIRNIGLLLSGNLEQPILDADTVVAVDGKITAVGKAERRRQRRRDPDHRCQGHDPGAGTDRQPRASGGRRLDAAPEPDRLD